MGLCVFSPQMYAHVEQKSNTICPTDQTDKPNDGEVKRGRPICFYRSFVSLFNFIPPILCLHPIPLFHSHYRQFTSQQYNTNGSHKAR